MARPKPRSIAPFITMGVILVVMVLALTIGWNILIVSDYWHLRRDLGAVGTGHLAMLVLGTLVSGLVIA